MKPLLTSLAFALLASLATAQDTSLKDNLIEGEGWQEAVTGFAFTDGLASDSEGNLYFGDVKTGQGIYKLGLDGKVNMIVDGLPGISGMHVTTDGRIIACQYKAGRVVEVSKEGAVKELLTGITPNDLIVTKAGFIYVTETGPGRIHCITPDGKTFVADEGHVIKPNGITLSADQNTLVASEHGGSHVWAWQIQSDGTLVGATPWMTLLVSPNNAKGEAMGDGSTTDEKGRYYVTTELGIQVFDTFGRLSGVIAFPNKDAKGNGVDFAGPGRSTLYTSAGGSIWKRKLNTKGAWY